MQVGVDPNVENMYGCTALRNALVNGKHMPSCREAARVIEDAGAYEILNPDQNPDEAADDSIPRFPRIPRGEFERLGGPFVHTRVTPCVLAGGLQGHACLLCLNRTGIPPLDQLQLDHTKPVRLSTQQNAPTHTDDYSHARTQPCMQAYGTMKKDVVKYFRDEEEKIEKLREKMERQLIENADVSKNS